MKADLYTIQCGACGGSWLEASYDLATLPTDWPTVVSKRPYNVWRYRELLPFSDKTSLISMGEGWTPLIRAKGLERETSHAPIWIKDERQQPTGSFKDRQAALAVSTLRAQAVEELVLASTGNALRL